MKATPPLPETVADTEVDVAQAWADLGHYKGVPGFLHVCSNQRWDGTAFPTTAEGINQAVEWLAAEQRRGAHSVYHRGSTLRTDWSSWLDRGRGGAADSAAVVAFALDIDTADDDAHRGTPSLPTTEEDVRRALAETDLPEPTEWVNSGHGFYPRWRLTAPTEDIEAARELQVDLDAEARRIWTARGWKLDNTSDGARVWRVVGSVNGKVAKRPVRCTWTCGSGEVFTFAELRAAVPERQPPPAPDRRAGTKKEESDRVNGPSTRSGPGTFAVMSESWRGGLLSWGDVLEPAGWTFVDHNEVEGFTTELWLRPGGATSAYSLRAGLRGEAVAVAWSDATELPPGPDQALSIGRVFAWLHHGGNESEAARDLVRAAHGRPSSPVAAGLPLPFLDAVAAVTARPSQEAAMPSTTDGTKKEESGPPVPDPVMFAGVLGDIVCAADPHTEADPVGVLVTLLSGAGVLVGPSTVQYIGATRHPLLVWPLLFGNTGSGRKGETTGIARKFLLSSSEDAAKLSVTGLSSGEGLIERIKDTLEGDDDTEWKVAKAKTGGTTDKRLFVVEPEFAGTMARSRREGSTLGAVLREAWDGGALAVLNRQALRASSSHVGIVGHITPQEFRLRLAEADMSGGTYNRFLPVYVDRSKRLPIPTAMDQAEVDELAQRLTKAIDAAREIEQVRFGREAAAWWTDEVYDELTDTDDEDTAASAFVQRAAPYTVRVAALHAVLDGRDETSRDDLAAAVALVRYSMSSARFVLNRQVRNPRLDRIRRAIDASTEGLTRSEVSGLFSRNVPAAALDELLAELVDGPDYEERDVPTRGRPARRYARVLSSFVVPENMNEEKSA